MRVKLVIFSFDFVNLFRTAPGWCLAHRDCCVWQGVFLRGLRSPVVQPGHHRDGPAPAGGGPGGDADHRGGVR